MEQLQQVLKRPDLPRVAKEYIQSSLSKWPSAGGSEQVLPVTIPGAPQ